METIMGILIAMKEMAQNQKHLTDNVKEIAENQMSLATSLLATAKKVSELNEHDKLAYKVAELLTKKSMDTDLTLNILMKLVEVQDKELKDLRKRVKELEAKI